MAPSVWPERQEALMEHDEARPVADRDDGRIRQALEQQAVEHGLCRLVERRRRLVEEQPVGLLQERAGDR